MAPPGKTHAHITTKQKAQPSHRSSTPTRHKTPKLPKPKIVELPIIIVHM